MFQLIIALMISLSTSFSLGHASDHEDYLEYWDVVSDHSEKATNPTEYKALQKKYPEYFKKHSAAGVTLATVHHLAFRYKGETICKARDPRLKFETVSYGLCRKVDGKSRCFANSGALPLPEDPCEIPKDPEDYALLSKQRCPPGFKEQPTWRWDPEKRRWIRDGFECKYVGGHR